MGSAPLHTPFPTAVLEGGKGREGDEEGWEGGREGDEEGEMR